MSKVELAVSCYNEGFSCSQAILSTFGGSLGLERETALKLSGVFRGGMAHMGGTCGAVTGAFMIIGLKYGNTAVEDELAKEKTNNLALEFVEKFKSYNGSILCKELLGCDISTSEGMKYARNNGLFNTRCPDLVRDAAEIIEQICNGGH